MTELSPIAAVHDTRVLFRNGDIPIAGTIWLPSLIQSGRGCPAIVVSSTPACGPIGATYARHLAEEGYVALAFASPSDRASGTPRSSAEQAAGPGDIGSALDFLSALPFVDQARMGLLRIGDDGESAGTTAADPRVRAVQIVAVERSGDTTSGGPGVGPSIHAADVRRLGAIFGERL